MHAASRYNTILAVTTGAIMLVIVACNALVDPYGVHGLWCRAGINAHKPGMHGHDRMVKAYAIEKQQPDALLLGTSRVQYSLDPDAPELRSRAQRPHNAGLLNCSLYLAYRYLQHAQAVRPQKLVVLGLDPLMFDSNTKYDNSDFLESRLRVDAAQRPYPLWQRGGDLAPTLASWDALGLSLRTLVGQQHIISDILVNGQRSGEAIEDYFRRQGGTFFNVAYVEKIYLRDYRTAALHRRAVDNDPYQRLASMLDYARAAHVDLRLYLTPAHTILGEVARAVGKLDEIDSWKRAVVQVVSDHNARYSAAAPTELWDFSAPGNFTSEALPQSADDPTTLHWFWEATHHRPALGNLVLQRLLHLPGAAASQNFGTLLNQANVDQVLHAQRQAQDAYHATHPDDVLRVQALEIQGRAPGPRLY